MKSKGAKEWFEQAQYDFETALFMYKSGRNVYAVFFCHLSIEKALKGLIVKNLQTEPPRTHNLTYLKDKLALKLTEEADAFLFELSDTAIPARYPENLKKLFKIYSKKITGDILKNTKTLLAWLKNQ